MRVVVYGLWHLGCVTAACTADAGNDVVALDLDGPLVDRLNRGNPPLDEPGLPELIDAGLKAGRLSFTTDAQAALHGAAVLWVTFDTPVDEQDHADVGFVRERLERVRGAVQPGTLVLISSQVPVGFTRALAGDWAGLDVRFGVSPENLRLGKAIETFRTPERVIVGLTDPGQDRDLLTRLLQPFGPPGTGQPPRIEWMTPESAEMTKHAINAFLAVSVTFINELARLCEAVGANVKEVERGLKSEGRIGPRAYLGPGAAFAGGTLARDVRFLVDYGHAHGIPTPLFDGTWSSNEAHKDWTRQKVAQLLEGVREPTVAVLGLTYKLGTSTLRRSASVELCRWMHARGVRVRAHDPGVRELPGELKPVIELAASPAEALRGADLAVLATEWPAFKALRADDVVAAMRAPNVIDSNWFAAAALADDPRVTYIATGRAPGGRSDSSRAGQRAADPGAPDGPEPSSAPPTVSVSESGRQGAPEMQLRGRRALITGASRGLGREIAMHYVRAGASVVLTGREESPLAEAHAALAPLAIAPGQRVAVVQGDVGDPAHAHAAAAALAGLPGNELILVNNAGVYGPKGLIEEVEWVEWEQAVRINLFGMVHMCRAVIPLMRQAGYGKIVNLSGGGATQPLPRLSAYAAAKAAVVRTSETLAAELRDANVDVNAIAPGALNTRMLDEAIAAGPEKVGRAMYERLLKQREEGGSPIDRAAELVVFLGSAASDGITGRLISAPWDNWEKFPQWWPEMAGTDIYTLRRIVARDRGRNWDK